MPPEEAAQEQAPVTSAGAAGANCEGLLGRWAYVGRKGVTEYCISTAPDGSLLFEGPDARGTTLTGLLWPEGRWLQADLEADGETAGSIRLGLLEGRCAVVSNFRSPGKAEWGRDIVAHRSVAPADDDGGVGDGPFTQHAGHISAGGDLLVAEMTLEEAKARCKALPRCKGFCFKGGAGRAEDVLKVYFKSKWNLVRPRQKSKALWTSFRFDARVKGREAEDWLIVPEEESAEQEGEALEPSTVQEVQVRDLNVIPGKPCLWDLEATATAAEALAALPPMRPGAPWPRAALPRLLDRSVERYRRDGFVGPLHALTEEELRRCQEGLWRFTEGHCQGVVDNANTLLNHVTLPWLYELVRHPRIVGAVASALGTEDVLLFNSCMFLRDPGLSCEQQLGVGWHTDGILYDRVLSPMQDWITVFLALTPCMTENGCLQYCPLRMVRGPKTDDRKFPYMELEAGQFSLHSHNVTHRAGTNAMSYRRDCLALRYLSGRVRDMAADAQPDAERDWAILCAGMNRGHFQLLPQPSSELGSAEVALRGHVAALRAERYGATRFKN